MQETSNTTTVLCLFHTQQQAQEALAELEASEVPASSIAVLDQKKGMPGGSDDSVSVLRSLGLPERDMQLLSEGVYSGGTVIIVSGAEAYTDKAETIFGRHRAEQIDQKIIGNAAPAATEAVSDGVIPVVKEELTVGKREVQRGGVRVYSRVVETPVEEKVVLREEHATVERHAVNRPISEADMEAMRIQSIEVTEMAEVPVVQKTARVVEEVMVSKEVSENTQHISDSVRETEVEVEQIETGSKKKRSKGKEI